MSNIAKQIAATVVFGLFAAGTPALAGAWEGEGSSSCGKLQNCERPIQCTDGTMTAVSGSCGGADDNKIRVVYTGRDPDLNSTWLCRVFNTSDNEGKTFDYAVYCAK